MRGKWRLITAILYLFSSPRPQILSLRPRLATDDRPGRDRGKRPGEGLGSGLGPAKRIDGGWAGDVSVWAGQRLLCQSSDTAGW